MIAVVRTTVMATKVKTMMTNRLVSKLDAVDLAGGRHDLCFNKLRTIPGPFRSQIFTHVVHFLDRYFSIDFFRCLENGLTNSTDTANR